MLKRILFISSDKKKWNKTEKDIENMEKAEKENNTDERGFTENEILDLNSLKPFDLLTAVAVMIKSSHW